MPTKGRAERIMDYSVIGRVNDALTSFDKLHTAPHSELGSHRLLITPNNWCNIEEKKKIGEM